MKSLILIAALLVMLAVLASCSKRIYSPALYQNDILLMQKPFSKDEKKSAVYLSGSYVAGSSNIYGGNTTQGGTLNIYRSHTLSNFNLSYGLIGFAGSEKDSTALAGTQKFSFTGLGLNTSVSYYKNFGSVDWRIIGVDMAYTHEFGDYLAYRKTIRADDNTYVAKQAGLYTITAFTEIIGKTSEKVSVGGRFFLSRTLGPINRDLHFESFFDIFTGVTAYANYNHLTGSVTFATPRFFQSASFQLGLGYRF